MRWLSLLAATALLLILSAGTASAQPVGKDVYTSYCSGCHGQDGSGLTVNAPDFSAESFWENRTRQGLLSRVENGVPRSEMPAWGGRLSEAQMEAALQHATDFAGVELQSLPEGTPFPEPTSAGDGRTGDGPGALLGIAALAGGILVADRVRR